MSSPLQVPILMYHRIAEPNPRSTVPGHYVAPRLFARQLRLLKRLNFTTVSLNKLFSDSPMPEKPIVLTFDDGYSNFFECALPALNSAGLRATVFLVANCVGKSNLWDEQMGDTREPLMSLEQVMEASRSGTEFGSHTLDHADLSALPVGEAWRQIADSKCILEQAIGAKVTSFCYPYGRKTPEVQAMVPKAGYRFACGTEKGVNTADTDPTALRRINVRQDTSVPVLLYKLMRGKRFGR